MPYGFLDYINPNDQQDFRVMYIPRFGLNVKLSPFVVVKVEAAKVIPAEDMAYDKMWSLVGQMAVSF